jgi:hypothetical protein
MKERIANKMEGKESRVGSFNLQPVLYIAVFCLKGEKKSNNKMKENGSCVGETRF